jgi:hypothetical protein
MCGESIFFRGPALVLLSASLRRTLVLSVRYSGFAKLHYLLKLPHAPMRFSSIINK